MAGQPSHPSQAAPQVVYVQQPPKKSSGCFKLAAIGAGGLFVLVVAMCGVPLFFFGKESREQRERGIERIENAVSDAKVHYSSGNLEQAVRALESVVLTPPAGTFVSDELEEAQLLLQQYGTEYGERFREEADAILLQAREAIDSGNADEARRLLRRGIDLRYPPNIDDLNSLYSKLREAQSEERMKQFVRAMTDDEFAAFNATLDVPPRAVFDDPGLNAIFVRSLMLNRDKASEWRESVEQARQLRRTGTGRLTLSNFERIQDGMTLAQVESLLGKGRIELSSSGGGHSIEVYVWGDGLPNARVTFTNGRVDGKAQFGLR